VAASRDQREQRIEAFAAEFLLPTSAVERAWHHDGEETVRRRLMRLAARYRVSWSCSRHHRAACGAPRRGRRPAAARRQPPPEATSSPWSVRSRKRTSETVIPPISGNRPFSRRGRPEHHRAPNRGTPARRTRRDELPDRDGCEDL
jgi:hypothetical protein